MTRINAFIEPTQLTRQHLIAEHREIKRIPNMVDKGWFPSDIPAEFCLGTGHVKFFRDKLLWLRKRYVALFDECWRRGYEVTYFEPAWFGLEEDYGYADWHPSAGEIDRIRSILYERLGYEKQR